jgi:hypothetical protein
LRGLIQDDGGTLASQRLSFIGGAPYGIPRYAFIILLLDVSWNPATGPEVIMRNSLFPKDKLNIESTNNKVLIVQN